MWWCVPSDVREECVCGGRQKGQSEKGHELRVDESSVRGEGDCACREYDLGVLKCRERGNECVS